MNSSHTSYTKQTYIIIVHTKDNYDPLTWDIKMTVQERNVLQTVKIKRLLACVTSCVGTFF